MPKSILVVDDDALIRRSLAISIEQAGYQVRTAPNGENALDMLRVKPPDLILLDIGLPGMDGLEALRAFRNCVDGIPVIFLTARRRELDEVVGLELGADDYITKPFDMDVLLAHVKAVLRRATPQLRAAATAPLVVGDLSIDAAARVVQVGERVLDLPPKEFELLLMLAQNAERVLPLDELLKQVWGADWVGESQTLYVHIRWLREKIEEDPARPRRLLTMRGAGYKLVPIR
ncbi:MAG: response regulator transcription factor [Caldilineaceae bacterium]